MPADETQTFTIQLPPQTRSFTLERGEVQADQRSVALSFSSEYPVLRAFPKDHPDKRLAGKQAFEVLDHGDGACDFSRLRALLVDHDPKQQIGTVENPRIEGKRGQTVARFSRSAQGQKEFDDVQDGIRTEISCGYSIRGYRLDPTPGQPNIPTMRVMRWQPYEVSLLALPADPTVGIGRGASVDCPALADCLVERGEEPQDGSNATRAAGDDPQPTDRPRITMTEEDKAAQAKKDRETARKEESVRQNEIRAIADNLKTRGFDASDLATAALNDGTSIEEFRGAALEKLFKAKPINLSPDIGMSDKEKAKYSLLRAVRAFVDRKPFDGLEAEASRAMEKIVGSTPEGFFIPNDVAADAKGQRDLNVTTATQGGNTVQTDVLGGSMIELLRNKQVVRRLGARSMDGLTGNVAIPRQTGAATGYSVAEQGNLTESTQAIGQLALSPKRIGAFNDYSKQLLAQSSIDVENFVRMDLMTVLAILSDYLAINGTGSNNQPTGILATTGIGAVTFGAAATWAKIIDFETQVANANADFGSLAYLTSPNVRAKLKALTKIANSQYSDFIWEKSSTPGDGIINSYLAVASKQMDSDRVVFGNFADLILAGWAGLDVVVDPYSQATAGTVRITVNQFMDVGVRHAGSFTASADAGNQ